MKHPTLIAINDLDLTAGTQLRAGLDKTAVADYAEIYRESGNCELGPITIYHAPGLRQPYVLIDGFHRVSAAHEVWPQGISLPCVCAGSGTLREAILQAAGVNAEHGVRRTDADKRRAVLQILSDAEWINWSDNKIAKICNVGNRLVGVLRRELISAANAPVQSPLPSRLASLPVPEVTKAVEAARKFSQPDRIVERGGTTFTQKSPATEPSRCQPTPLLQDLRIYTGSSRLDAKSAPLLDAGDIVELLSQEPEPSLNNVATGLDFYVRHIDGIKNKWLEPIPYSIGDTVPASDPTRSSGKILDYLVTGGTVINLKFIINYGEYKETLGMDEIADRVVGFVEQDWKDSHGGDAASIPECLMKNDELLSNLNVFLESVWYGDPFQFAIAPNLTWANDFLPKVIDYRQIPGSASPPREICDVAIVSQFDPNLCNLVNGCRQIIITACNSVILCYSLSDVLVQSHFNPALGCLKI